MTKLSLVPYVADATCVYLIDAPANAKISIPVAGADFRAIPVNASTSPGGLWTMIAQQWLGCKTQYICFMPPMFENSPDRFKRQIEFMQRNDLAASFGHTLSKNEKGNDVAWLEYADFHVDMIGSNTVPLESLLIDRRKFLDAGGFDHLLSGSYDPVRYITTMIACAGRVMRLDEYLVEKHPGAQDSMTNARLVADMDPDFLDMFKRWRMDKWIARAKQHYKTMRWS